MITRKPGCFLAAGLFVFGGLGVMMAWEERDAWWLLPWVGGYLAYAVHVLGDPLHQDYAPPARSRR